MADEMLDHRNARWMRGRETVILVEWGEEMVRSQQTSMPHATQSQQLLSHMAKGR